MKVSWSERHFLTCLSPKPLPSKPVWRGTSRDVEIDAEFARQLGILSFGMEVMKVLLLFLCSSYVYSTMCSGSLLLEM